MKLHWQILIALVAGVVVGGWVQTLDAPGWIGATLEQGADGGARITALDEGAPVGKAKLAVGAVILEAVAHRDDPDRREDVPVTGPDVLLDLVARSTKGEVLWLLAEAAPGPVPVAVGTAPDSQRAAWIEPFAFVADIFLSLLKMLIVPIVLTSIITGVAGVGTGRDLRRMGAKTFGYYIATSMLAVFLGQMLVNIIQPGEGAQLGLEPDTGFEEAAGQSFWQVLLRMIPSNIFTAFSDNRQMLSVIFFALLFGYFITQVAEPHRSRMSAFFDSAFQVMMKMASFVLSLIPYGVFALLVEVVGEAGFGLFEPLALYMATVTGGLLLHALVTLPLLLRFVGRISPLAWAKAMGPALMTAFSTSSSSMTLPVTLETVEHRGKVSNKTTSFVLPLGATINMDGTALYECIGVIFLAQYYAGFGTFELTLGDQVLVVMMALMASIGAAGIPSAGLVMMLTILGALNLPLEGAALLLAVDRPLDMLRTVVNVWSDSCGAAIIARTEGEQPLTEGPSVIEMG